MSTICSYQRIYTSCENSGWAGLVALTDLLLPLVSPAGGNTGSGCFTVSVAAVGVVEAFFADDLVVELEGFEVAFTFVSAIVLGCSRLGCEST
jgi:Mg/Co/Ni transporter MgtE